MLALLASKLQLQTAGNMSLSVLFQFLALIKKGNQKKNFIHIYLYFLQDEFSLFDKQRNEVYITGENFEEYTSFVSWVFHHCCVFLNGNLPVTLKLNHLFKLTVPLDAKTSFQLIWINLSRHKQTINSSTCVKFTREKNFTPFDRQKM